MARLLFGALAGVAATAAMTLTMNRLFKSLPDEDRYALPPRELVGAAAQGLFHEETERSASPPSGDPKASSSTQAIAAHFAFGAATGALFAAQPRRDVATGTLYALGVWSASYLGWAPASRLLRPATQHPTKRNELMLGAHVVWGSTLALVLAGIEDAARNSFSARGRPLADEAPRQDRPSKGPAQPSRSSAR
jgi:hypothetical protein